MNVVKKVIAVVTIAIILIRIFTIEAFAFAGAPVIAAEEITVLLETALVGSGLYTESELEGKSYYELNDLLKDGINSNQINPKSNYYTDPISGIQFNLFDLFTKPEVQAGIGIINSTVSSVVDNAISDFFSDYEKLSDSVEFTPTIDLEGNGAMALLIGETSMYWIERRIYGDYGVINPNIGTGSLAAYQKINLCSNENSVCYVVDHITYKKDGSFFRDDYYFYDNRISSTQGKLSFSVDNIVSVQYYGDWISLDDTPVETDDTEIPIIGEADGTQVTPDMLNPDGTVTIDGTTYYPKDFIDWDKFKDPAIIDLLNKILSKLEEAPVIDDSKLDIGEIDTDVALPSELSDFSTPGLIDVFPFCLPYDFIRGMQLFSAEPEVPHFEKEITIPAFLNVPEQKWKFEIDFKELEPLAKITRWTSLISFVYCLILLTPKIAKGA